MRAKTRHMLPEPVRNKPRRYRIGQEVREAVHQMVTTGCTQRKAAEVAGMNETALGRALKRENVKQYMEQQKALFLSDINDLQRMSSAIAHQVGMDLMHNAKSESVRARMVELFKGERDKTPQVSVNIQQNIGGQGYEYAPPGAQIVDVTPANKPDKEPDADA